MMRRARNILVPGAAALALQACGNGGGLTEPESGRMGLSRGLNVAASALDVETARRSIVLFASERVPVDFATRVAMLGGSVEASLDAIGVATVTGLSGTAAAELASDKDVRSVEQDVTMSVVARGLDAPDTFDEMMTLDHLAPIDATASPASAPLYPRQWNMHVIRAAEAWEAGHVGSSDVVVAILDTGIDYLHPELVGLVDLERSTSFVPEDEPIIAERFPGRRPFSDLHAHGTAASSIVATNGTMVAGVNRNVTLLAVKIWDRTAQGPISRLISGIVYAADHGADVISVSGAYSRDKDENPGIIAAVQRAVNYAFRNGALLISITGNDAADLDRDGDMVRLPCEAANAICASGTAPTGVAGITGPWEGVDALAPYSAFGHSAVDLTAPAGFGDFANPGPTIGQFRRIMVPCTTTPTETSLPACAAGMPIAQPWGTSWAAPHIAGLAALLVAELGHGKPALIRARILQSADDVGERGNDRYFGRGRINVARALGLAP